MENLAKAIIKVMEAVKGIEKNMQVGSGNSGYKGVSDKEVKQTIGKAMQDNGLCILPVSVDAKTEISRWEAQDQYGTKQKQSVFTEVRTKYLLLHTSGESQVIEGYGHGVDAMDKSAGKATTYALKYALLYSFLVPTGTILDADKDPSENHEAPPSPEKRINDEVSNAVQNLANCKTVADLKFMKDGLSPEAANHAAYKAAATIRYNQINDIKPVAETSQTIPSNINK